MPQLRPLPSKRQANQPFPGGLELEVQRRIGPGQQRGRKGPVPLLALKVLSDARATDKRIRADLRRSFKNAAAGVLCDRVNQILAAQSTPSNSRALVIVNQDEAAAQGLLDSAKVKSTKVTLTSHGIGTYAGREAGKSIRLQEEVK